MRDITKFAIENSRITLCALLLVFIMGIISYVKLPKAEDPGFVVRKARVVTFFPGASPDRMEQLVTDKLEKAIQEMPELEFIKSESRSGVSVITVKMWDRYKVMQPLWDTLRRKVDRTVPQLPKGIVGPFVNDEFGDVFGTLIAITGEGFSYRELKEVADRTKDELLYIDEVAKVDIMGEQDERIFIEFSDAKLADMGVSSLQIKQLLESRNIVIPGGSVFTDQEQVILEPSGNFDTLEELTNAVIHLPAWPQPVYLNDIATVSRGYVDPPSSLMHYNGQPSILLAVSLREGGNVSVLGEQVSELVTRLQYFYPLGIDFHYVNQEAVEVTHRVDTFISNLVQSCTLVLVIMLASLGIRTGLVVAGLIPMTILSTFVFMRFFDIGIDQTSLSALIIALGMLVDNAIVMSEAIFTEISQGVSPKQAAINCSKELRTGLLTASLTTSFAFLPIFLAKSVAGEYTSSLFKVVTIALLSSWVLALTMIPLLCVTWIKVKNSEVHTDQWLYRWYGTELAKRLKSPLKQVGIFAAMLVVAVLCLKLVPRSFFPDSDRHQFTVKYELPVGVKIEHTEKMIKQIEDYMKKDLMDQGIIDWVTFIGGVTPRYILNHNPVQLQQQEAYMLINTKSENVIPELMTKIESYVCDECPSMRVSPEPTKFGPPVTAPIEVRISGLNQDNLFAYAQDVKEKLKTLKGVKNVRDDWGEFSKKLVANVDEARAMRAGVTNRDVAVSLQTMLSGLETTQFRELDEVIPVTIRSVSSDRNNLDKLESLNVYSQTSKAKVPLKQVADLELTWQPNNILRRNRLRTVTVMADVEQGYHPQKLAGSIKPWLDQEKASWSVDSFYEFGGEKEKSEESAGSIVEQVPFAALLIVLLLVSQFNSFRHALIILATIPMGVIGVTIGLIVTGASMGFMVFLGIVSLSGIVINDAIVLLERIKHEQDNGVNPFEAVVEASKRRMRPILLTTYTTVGGMLPLWLGGGPMFKPMAIAIIFGLIFATLLTLVFVPVLYCLFYQVKPEES